MNHRKYTVITGASTGIGYSTAKTFAKRGKNLILIARREELLEQLKSEIIKYNAALHIIIKVIDISITANAYQLYEDLKPYYIETWINNAGIGNYSSIANQDLSKIETMLRLNIESLTIFSSLYARDYYDKENTQLINISSAGGYTIVPNAVTYCATKFYVSTFTEGLAKELIENGSLLRAKVLAPAATRTEFGKVANGVTDYDYDKSFGTYHTSDEIATFLLTLYDSDKTIGRIDRSSFEFILSDSEFSYANS